MTLQNKGSYRDKLTLYIPPEKKEMIKKVSLILERENSSISKFFIEKLEEYYRLHEPGNPQQTLTHILKHGKPYRAPKEEAKKKRIYVFGTRTIEA
jgi:hypothetical protein